MESTRPSLRHEGDGMRRGACQIGDGKTVPPRECFDRRVGMSNGSHGADDNQPVRNATIVFTRGVP